MENCKFSVSICVYDGDNAENFDRAMSSIFSQTVVPDEVVLVVDGPVNSGIEAVIDKYESEYSALKVLRLSENQGHGVARRTGLDACTCELVAIMDSDDVCLPDRFRKQLEAFSADGTLDIVGGNITEFIGDEENIVGRRIVPEDDSEIKEYMKYRCPMNLVTVMFKKSSVEAVGGFIDWHCEEDYYLWARMLLGGQKFKNLGDILVNVRVGADMYKRRGGLKYFKSEAKFQKYLLDTRIITRKIYMMNVAKRAIVQVMLPNSVRGWVFKKFAREKVMPEKKYKVGYTTGVFDMFHIGHLNILRRAKEMCDYLIVGVSTDELVEEYKNKRPIIPFSERCEIVEAIKYVDKVVPQETRNKIEAFDIHGFDVMFVGDDWKGSDVFAEVDSYMKSKGAQGVEYIPYTQNISSTILKDVLNKIYNEEK